MGNITSKTVFEDHLSSVVGVALLASAFIIPFAHKALKKQLKVETPGASAVMETDETWDDLNLSSAIEYLRCAEACSASYFRESAKLDDMVEKWGFKDARSREHDGGHLRFLVLTSEDSTTIVFRGTDNLKNAGDDLDALDVVVDDTLGGARFHEGFHRAASIMYKDVLKHLKKDSRVYVLGHSLGGAIAVITSLFLARDGYSVVKTLTIGQPRVTFKEDIPKIQDKIHLLRIVNENDPVCLVPPCLPKYPYSHFGSRVYLGTNGLSTAQDLEVGDIHELMTAALSDHSCLTYIPRCQALVNSFKKGINFDTKTLMAIKDRALETSEALVTPAKAKN